MDNRTGFLYAKAVVNLLTVKYLEQIRKNPSSKNVEGLKIAAEEMGSVLEAMNELNNENIVLRQNNSNMFLALMKQQKEIDDEKAKCREWEKKFDELIKSI